MKRFGLALEEMPRLNPFHLPVRAIGYSPEKTADAAGVRHQGFNIGLTLSGKGGSVILEIDGARHAFKIPCFTFSMPGATYRHLTPLPSELFYLCYGREHMARLLAMGVGACLPGFAVEHSPRLTDLLGRIFALADAIHQRGNVDRLDRLCEQLLNEMLLARGADASEGSRNERKARAVASHLEIHYREPLDLARLAAENGFTPRTLLRHWGKIIPTTPAKYVNQLRVREAERLLAESDMAIGDIARDVGLEDPLHFSKLFRKLKGTSPSARREALRRRP